QKGVAARLSVSEQLVGHWETARRVPGPTQAGALDTLYGTDGMFGRILSLADLASGESPEWLGEWQRIERRATMLRSFQPSVIDGLRQTEEYARAVLDDRRFHLTDVDGVVSARLDRQRVLQSGGKPPTLIVLMHETVLDQPVGPDPTVMSEQLTYLAEVF